MDDWRIRITVESGDGGLIDRLGLELGGEAGELAHELEQRRLAVSQDGDALFVYAASHAEATRAREVIEAVLRDEGLHADVSRVEHWLEEDERWDDEPPQETWEEDELDRGYAPWEVRVTCGSHHEARELGRSLEAEGYRPLARFQYLIVGTASKEDAEALAQRLHGQVEGGGELVAETNPGNPFSVFGGLGA
jgi:hypothetical protein